jgi:uncharacterized protein YukE
LNWKSLLTIACVTCSIAGTAAGEDKTFPDNAKQVWISRTDRMVQAANAQTDDAGAYIDGLKAACEGLTAETFSVRQPYWAMKPQGTFCIAVGELAKEAGGGNTNALGRTKMFAVGEYCRQFSATISQAKAFKSTPETATIYDSAQQLAGAAEKVKATRIEIAITTRTLGGLGFSGADSHRTKVMQCN